jgi:hypothetical protein
MSYPHELRRAAPHALATSLALVCGLGAATPPADDRSANSPPADHAALAREVLPPPAGLAPARRRPHRGRALAAGDSPPAPPRTAGALRWAVGAPG